MKKINFVQVNYKEYKRKYYVFSSRELFSIYQTWSMIDD